MRAYGLPNLIQRDDVTVTIDAPEKSPINAKELSTGLVAKDAQKACSAIHKPKIGQTGTTDFASYTVESADFVSGRWKATLEFDKEYF